MISLVPEYGTHEYVRWRSYVTADSLRSIVDVTDTFAMQTLRNVLQRANVPIDLARSSTEQVLQFAARCVNFGELVLVVDAKQGRHTNQWISSHDLARGHARASSAVTAAPVEEPDEITVMSPKAASNIRDFTLTLSEEYCTILGKHAVLVDGTRYKLTTDLGEVREGTVRGGEIKEAKLALDQSARVEIIGVPHEIAQMAGTIPWLAYAGDNIEEHEIFYEIVDAKTESPIETMTYKLTSGSKTLIDGQKMSGGKSQPQLINDHPNLSFVAWVNGSTR